jgi:hypothetical protein
MKPTKEEQAAFVLGVAYAFHNVLGVQAHQIVPRVVEAQEKGLKMYERNFEHLKSEGFLIVDAVSKSDLIKEAIDGKVN